MLHWRFRLVFSARLLHGGSGYKTDVWVNDDGGRVAVLLLDARHFDTAQREADQVAPAQLALGPR
jgi:hypothetical protein